MTKKHKTKRKSSVTKKHHTAKRRKIGTAHVGAKRRASKRRKMGALPSGMLTDVGIMVLGGLIGRAIDNTVQNSTTLNLKPKDATKTDYTPYITPVLAGAALYFVKNPMIKKAATGALITTASNLVPQKSLPKLIGMVPQTVGAKALPQTVGAKRVIRLNGAASPRPSQSRVPLLEGQKIGAIHRYIGATM